VLLSRPAHSYLQALPFSLPLVLWLFPRTKGIDFTDEGLYVSMAWRFYQGDLPFRDEVMSLFSSPVTLRASCSISIRISLLGMRILGFSLQLFAFICLFILLISYARLSWLPCSAAPPPGEQTIWA